MPRIAFVYKDGTTKTVEATSGSSVMQAAVDSNVNGIVGECGGACQCATCHVYVDPAWVDRLPPADEMERGMLEGAYSELLPTSRLSCEIVLTAELDGLIIHLPERQI